jgi:hypothetical protein
MIYLDNDEHMGDDDNFFIKVKPSKFEVKIPRNASTIEANYIENLIKLSQNYNNLTLEDFQTINQIAKKY